MAMNKIPCMYGKEMKVVTHDKFKTMTKKKKFPSITFANFKNSQNFETMSLLRNTII